MSATIRLSAIRYHALLGSDTELSIAHVQPPGFALSPLSRPAQANVQQAQLLMLEMLTTGRHSSGLQTKAAFRNVLWECQDAFCAKHVIQLGLQGAEFSSKLCGPLWCFQQRT